MNREIRSGSWSGNATLSTNTVGSAPKQAPRETPVNSTLPSVPFHAQYTRSTLASMPTSSLGQRYVGSVVVEVVVVGASDVVVVDVVV